MVEKRNGVFDTSESDVRTDPDQENQSGGLINTMTDRNDVMASSGGLNTSAGAIKIQTSVEEMAISADLQSGRSAVTVENAKSETFGMGDEVNNGIFLATETSDSLSEMFHDQEAASSLNKSMEDLSPTNSGYQPRPSDVVFQINDISWLFEPSMDPYSIDSMVFDSVDKFSHPSPTNSKQKPRTLSLESISESPDSSVNPWVKIRDDIVKCLFGEALGASTSSPLQTCTLSNVYSVDLTSSWLYQPYFLQKYFLMYFENYHEHFPILHKPSVLSRPDKVPPLLMIAITTLGTAFAVEEHFSTSVKIHERLQFLVLSHKEINHPPLWIFQTLTLVQAYQKMLSTRQQHDMSSTLHGSMMLLLHRNIAHTSYTSEENNPNVSLETRWHRWIYEESRRRALLFAFVMDAQHVALFGHKVCISANEMLCQIPCMENVWEAETAEDWHNLYNEQDPASRNTSFLGALKSLLMHKPLNTLQTSHFSRLILLHGIYAVAIQMQQQESIFGMSCSHCRKDQIEKTPNWKESLAGAISNWSYCLYTQKSMTIEVCKALHHFAYVTLYLTETSVLDILMLSGLSLYDRLPKSIDYVRASSAVKAWTQRKEDCVKCVTHALFLMQEILFSGQNYQSDELQCEEASHYLAKRDKIALRPWVLLVSSLVVWAFYSFLGTNKQLSIADTTMSQQLMLTEQFFASRLHALSLDDPIGEFIKVDKNSQENILCVISVVHKSIEGCRWELIEEGYHCLGKILEQRR